MRPLGVALVLALGGLSAVALGGARPARSAEAPAEAAKDSASETQRSQTATADASEDASTQAAGLEDASEAAVAEPDPRLEPATRAAKKVLALRHEVLDKLTHTAYEHRTKIRHKDGFYEWDCSVMGAWFLRKAAPVARGALDKGRPLARDFYKHIKRAPTRRPKKGWQRLSHIEDVRPGDVFAWIRPPGFPSRNTGHMGFALAPAEPVPDMPGAYTLRIFDATSLPHDEDTRQDDPKLPGERWRVQGGIGEGTILFMTDEDGQGTAYGWFGRRSRGVIETEIVFGRVSR